MKNRTGEAMTSRLVAVLAMTFLLTAGVARGEPEASAVQTSPAQGKLIQDMVKIVTDQNTPIYPSRKTAAGSLLLLGDPEADRQLLAILANAKDRQSQLAVTAALTEIENPDPQYQSALIDNLLAGDPALQEASTIVLSRYRDPGLIERMGQIIDSDKRPLPQRLAAIGAMGKMRSKQAVAVLITLMERLHRDRTGSRELKLACARSLYDLTLVDYSTDVSAWQKWWEKNKNKDDLQWLQGQLDILANENRFLRTRLEQTERVLIETLVRSFRSAPKNDAERVKTIQEYLASSLSAHRLAALQMLTIWISQNQGLPLELQTSVRSLLGDQDPIVRCECAKVLRDGKDVQAVEALLGQLEKESEPLVKRELLVALGQLGGPELLDRVLPQLALPLETVATGAAQALARIFQNDNDAPIGPEFRDAAVNAILQRYQQAGDDMPLLRQELLAAMGAIRDKRFLQVFKDALGSPDANVRLFGAAGLAALKDPAQIDLLLGYLKDDPEPGVRAKIATGIASLGLADDRSVVDQLVERLNPTVEKDKQVREVIFGAITTMVKRWPCDQQIAWAEAVFARAAWVDLEHRQAIVNGLQDQITAQSGAWPPDVQVSLFRQFGDLVLVTDRPAEAVKYYRQSLVAAKRVTSPPVEELADRMCQSILAAASGGLDPLVCAQFLNRSVGLIPGAHLEVLTDCFAEVLAQEDPDNHLQEFIAALSADFHKELSEAYRQKLAAMGRGVPSTAPALAADTQPSSS